MLKTKYLMHLKGAGKRRCCHIFLCWASIDKGIGLAADTRRMNVVGSATASTLRKDKH
ncbi:hypothetical protein AgCh_001112 [Apium graveolens]